MGYVTKDSTSLSIPPVYLFYCSVSFTISNMLHGYAVIAHFDNKS